MTSNYSKQVYELIGVKVLEKTSDKTGAGKHAGDTFYRLNITCENRPEVKQVKVFKDKVGTYGGVSQEEIWKAVVNSDYADKRYIFYCHRKDIIHYALVGWKELEIKW
ncbi:MAG: hypothetical protein MRERV_39c022 [Mycoplasmataceae bacterium RV_VA103A]|nr:MAG: hypothetical protein MRERV_39c022 [Mycoplasmataceae bacterium RV_VA103A]